MLSHFGFGAVGVLFLEGMQDAVVVGGSFFEFAIGVPVEGREHEGDIDDRTQQGLETAIAGGNLNGAMELAVELGHGLDHLEPAGALGPLATLLGFDHAVLDVEEVVELVGRDLGRGAAGRVALKEQAQVVAVLDVGLAGPRDKEASRAGLDDEVLGFETGKGIADARAADVEFRSDAGFNQPVARLVAAGHDGGPDGVVDGAIVGSATGRAGWPAVDAPWRGCAIAEALSLHRRSPSRRWVFVHGMWTYVANDSGFVYRITSSATTPRCVDATTVYGETPGMGNEMPRLGQVSRDDAPDDVKKVYQGLFGDRDPVAEPGTSTGTPGNWWTVFAQSPDVLAHCQSGFALLFSRRRKLDPYFRELGIVRTGFAMGSQFVFSQHSKAARSAGVPDEKVAAIPTWSTSDVFDAKDRAVLAYTDELTLGQGRVQDATFERLKAAIPDEEAIIELSYAIGLYTLHATVTKALRLEFDDVDERIVEVPAPEGGEGVDVMAQISRRE